MTKIEIVPPELIVRVEGLDQFWALRSELRLPLAHIASVERAADEARDWWHGLRLLGTHIPGVISAGWFYEHDGRVFWDVHDPDHAIAIRLHDERYAKLVIEVEDPDAAIAAVMDAVVRDSTPS